MSSTIPPIPANSFRITLKLQKPAKRLDGVLLTALRDQTENAKLNKISRVDFKKLFSDGKVSIKGQRAKPSSSLMGGITYVDIAGFWLRSPVNHCRCSCLYLFVHKITD